MDKLKKSHRSPSMKLFDNPPQEQIIWRVRESGLGATARVLRRFRKLLDAFDYGCALYGHFGQGCVHTRIDFDFVTREGTNHFRDFINHAADLVLEFGGSFSGEHGDGQARAELLPKMFHPS